MIQHLTDQVAALQHGLQEEKSAREQLQITLNRISERLDSQLATSCEADSNNHSRSRISCVSLLICSRVTKSWHFPQ
jgi:hypothetical protein